MDESKILSVFLYFGSITFLIAILSAIPILINRSLRHIYSYLKMPNDAPQIEFVLPSFLQRYIYTGDRVKEIIVVENLPHNHKLKRLLNGILFLIFFALWMYYLSYVFSFYYEFNACSMVNDERPIYTDKMPLYFKPYYYVLGRKGVIFMNLMMIGLPLIPSYLYYMFTLRSEYKKIFFIFFIFFFINFFFLHIFSLIFSNVDFYVSVKIFTEIFCMIHILLLYIFLPLLIVVDLWSESIVVRKAKQIKKSIPELEKKVQDLKKELELIQLEESKLFFDKKKIENSNQKLKSLITEDLKSDLNKKKIENLNREVQSNLDVKKIENLN